MQKLRICPGSVLDGSSLTLARGDTLDLFAIGKMGASLGSILAQRQILIPQNAWAVALIPNKPLVLESWVSPKRKKTMANIKSQVKRILTNKKATDRNRAVKSELKTAIRAAREATAAGDKLAAAAAVSAANRKLDKAVSKGVIHKNQAANRKSSLAKKAAGLK